MFKKLLKPIASRWPFPVLATLTSGRQMYVDLRSAIGRGIYMKGEFDPAVFDAIASRLGPGSKFIDVGANVGIYTFRSLDLIGDEGDVHAFEIDPRSIKCLRKTVETFNVKNVTIHDIAVSSEQGIGFLNQESDCGHSYVAREGNGLKVQTTSLDIWHNEYPCGSIDVIKIDVEGGEYRVLSGSINTIRKHMPLLVFEVNDRLKNGHDPSDREIRSFLNGLGYHMSELEGCWSPTIVATPPRLS